MTPIVVHIPHASRFIPENERGELLLDDHELKQELLAMTDAWTDELLQLHEHYEVRYVIAPVSRLVCDVERFRDDENEPMSKIGMGAIYERTNTGTTMRVPTDQTRARILETYYDPHHDQLTAAVDEVLAEAGACLVIDMHSFPSCPLPYEQDQSTNRPEICIGFDGVHGQFLEEGEWEPVCRGTGYECEANRPFSGSIVPAKHIGNENVLSAMIEVRRDLYMDESSGAKRETFDAVAQKVRVLAVAIAGRATKYVEIMSRMRVPYVERVPIAWSGKDLHVLTDALGEEVVTEAYESADAYVERVWAGEARVEDITTIPHTEGELAHYRDAVRRERLKDAIMFEIDENGEVVDEYCWDGAGEATSAGSSFYACVREWNGFYAWFSDVESAGPFTSLDVAVEGMNEHCG